MVADDPLAIATELLRAQYLGAETVEITIRFVVGEAVYVEQGGDRAWYSGDVKREELAPGFVVEWECRR